MPLSFRSRIIWFRPLLACAVVLIGASCSRKNPTPDTVASEQMMLPNRNSGLPGGIQSPLTEMTPPRPLDHILGPWEASRAVILGVTNVDVIASPERVKTYLQIIRLASRYVDVVILYPEHEASIESRIIRWLGEPDDARVKARLHFLPCRISSIWTRDYTPEYALGQQGKLVVLDPGTVDLSRDPTESLRYFGDLSGNGPARYYKQLTDIIGDDIAPSYISSFMRVEYDYAVEVVRPPVAVDGGDLIIADTKTIILSESTLRHNGGREDDLRATMQRYYGVNDVHFLPTLPGITIDHLDFIMLPVSAHAMLIAEAPATRSSKQIYDTQLMNGMSRILARNEKFLRTQLPKHKFIKVPMPPPISPTRAEVLNEASKAIMREACERYEIDWRDIASNPNGHPKRMAAEKQLARNIELEYGTVDFRREADLDRMSREFLRQSLDEWESTYVGDAVIYRTYLNSLPIHAADGRTLVMIPRYAPLNDDETRTFPEMERRVLAAYREAFPQADLQWIDADDLIKDFGAIHCIAHTLPAWTASK